MIIILGLIILIAALVVGVAGVLGNDGSAHALTHFSVLGYHVTGSEGTVFLSGIVVGAAGLLGLTLLLAATRRTSRRGTAARRGLKRSRRETAAANQERDDLISQRDSARANTTSNPSSGTAAQDAQRGPASDRWSSVRGLRRRLAPAQTTQSDPPDGLATPADSDVAVTSPAIDERAIASNAE